MQYLRLLFVLIICGWSSNVNAIDLKLPWTSGETWQVTVGYNGYCEFQGCPDDYHTDAHNGYYALDFDKPGVPEGSGLPILAAAGGTVTFAGGNQYEDFGYYVRINHGNGYETIYGHLLEWPMVSTNDVVVHGQQIGKLGSTGISTADHLHFGVFYNGDCLSTVPNSKPEPLSGYTNIAYGQLLTSDNTGITYLCSYVSQSSLPSSVAPGQVLEDIWVKFKNEGSATWTKTSGPSYVELASCNESATIGLSFFNYDFLNETCYPQSVVNWLNCQAPKTFDEASVPPGGTATFTFDAKVREDAAPGTHLVYFGPIYNGSIIPGWGQMHFPVNVATSPPYDGPDAIIAKEIADDALNWRASTSNGSSAFGSSHVISSSFGKTYHKYRWGDVNGDGYDDLMSIQTVTGGYNRIKVALADGNGVLGSPTVWHSNFGEPGDEYVVGDFNGDGKCDIAHSYTHSASEIGWFIVLSTGSGFGTASEWADNFGAQGDQWYAGDFTGDSKCDLAFRHEVSGTDQVQWKVKPSTGSGFGSTSVWVSDFGSPGQLSFVGDFTGDGKDDVARTTHYSSTEIGFSVMKSNGSAFVKLGEWSANFGNDGDHWFAAEMNGDGKCDLLQVRVVDYNTVRWRVSFSNGTDWLYDGGVWRSDFGDDGDWFYVANVAPTSMYSAKVQTHYDPIIPSSFTLRQNYPNPFNPVTTIEYSLPGAAHVRIDVYNILGQKVETVVDEQQTAGEHTASWNASRQASGVYFYRIQAGNAIETKKMVLLK